MTKIRKLLFLILTTTKLESPNFFDTRTIYICNVRQFKQYEVHDISTLKLHLLNWSNTFEKVCYLDSNKTNPEILSTFETRKHDLIVATGSLKEIQVEKNAFEALKSFYSSVKDWIFGHFTYDLKNELEQLASDNPDYILFPFLCFFQPRFIFILKGNMLQIGYLADLHSENEIDVLYRKILNYNYPETSHSRPIKISSRISKENYIDSVNELKKHIQQGDIYEVNFCQEFFAENAQISPISIYKKLNSISKVPFSAFYRLQNQYLMCASPERFIKKSGQKIISQPVKGTIRRSKNKAEDEELKKQLQLDPKEQSENVMIVDLVRNDLSRTAKQGSVKVEELFGIYSFVQVHQMISTVSAELRNDVHFIDAIKNAFPMGSMTGAPKIKAMQLIEQYESTKRGLYSGSVGYITPSGDFDFNVVIRSILYNAEKKQVSFMVGSAITINAVPEKEYQECLLKAKAMFEVFEQFMAS